MKPNLAGLFLKSISLVAAMSICAVATPIKVDVKAQAMSEALKSLASQTSMQLMVNPNLVKDKSTKSLKGTMEADNAFKKLLKNSGLEIQIKDDIIIIKEKKSKDKSSKSDLGDVDVIATNNNTEGSDSYTIDSMSTSTRLNLSIKDTPQSVKVLTNQKIKDQNIQSIEDMASATAGISMSKYYMTYNIIYSRGFEVDYYQVDGIPTTYYDSNQEDLVVYDRVEIVKGSNGLVSGAGSPAASINYVRKSAKSKDFQGSFELKTGSWNTYGATVDLASALNEEETIRARVIASYEENDSFIDEFNEKKNTFYGVIESDLSDNTLLSLTLSKQEFKNKSFTGAGLPIFFSDGSKTDFDRSTSFGSDSAYHNSTTNSASAKIEHLFNNDIKLSANYSYIKNEINEVRFWDRGNVPDKTTGILTIDNNGWNDSYSSETNALDIYSSIPFSLANRKHEFIAGLMYSKNDYDDLFKVGTGDLLSSSVYNWDNTTPTQIYTFDDSSFSETKQLGIYSVGKFSLSDSLKLIAGARVTNWEFNNEEENIEFNNNITPFLGLVYDINEQHSAYTSYTNIFKPQTDDQDRNGKYLDPKKGNSYEIGLKSSFIDESLNSSITLFRIDQDNVSIEDGTNVVLNTNDQAYKLTQGVVSKGVEIDLGGEINDNWNVGFGLAHYDAKDKYGEEVNSNDPTTQITLSTKYTIDKLSLGGGINWQNEFYEKITNPWTKEEEKISQKSYYLVNIMAKYDIKDNLSIQGNINNLFDEEYYSSIFYGVRYRYGDPRNVTLKLSYKF